MNKENIQKLIDHIRTHETQFDMNYIIKCLEGGSYPAQGGERVYNPSHCGTICCMLGWTNAISTNFSKNYFRFFQDVYNASDFLGISKDYATKLFFPGTDVVNEKNECNPWYQAHDMGLINIHSLVDSDCYNAPASVAITVLEAIRDGVIKDLMSAEN